MRVFVAVSRSEINKDESVSAGEAGTEDSHHDEPTRRRGFSVLVGFFSLSKSHTNEALVWVPCRCLDHLLHAVALPGLSGKGPHGPVFRTPTVRPAGKEDPYACRGYCAACAGSQGMRAPGM